jgi:hypothetical protein
MKAFKILKLVYDARISQNFKIFNILSDLIKR